MARGLLRARSSLILYIQSIIMKIRSILSLTAVLALAGGSSAFATTFVFSPGPGEANLGPSHLFTADGFNLWAFGYTRPSNTASDLYQKFDGVAETGLGMAADAPDTEIPAEYYIQLDVQDLINHGFTSMTFKLGSLQHLEQANIYGDTTAGSFADGSWRSTLTGGSVEQWVTLSLNTRYFNITGGGPNGQNATGGDPVLESVTANVPETSSTLLLFGASLLGVSVVRTWGRRCAEKRA